MRNPRDDVAFDDNICASPCPRFVAAKVDEDTGMVSCANCSMWFLDTDPTVEATEDDGTDE